MQDRKYLLSIQEFLEGENAGKLLEAAFSKVDSERYNKAKSIKHSKTQAASLGAGLLLQLAVKEACQTDADAAARLIANGNEMQDITEKNRTTAMTAAGNAFKYDTVSCLLEQIQYPMPLTYKYGKNGKPYLQDSPFYFNLSHSGGYVLCVLSLQEIGADIQQHGTNDIKRLTQRFFSQEETAAIEACKTDPNKLFYRLWARKEAYGKLTGRGIADTIGINFLPEPESMLKDSSSSQNTKVLWEEYEIPGYSIAICKSRNTP